MNIPHSESPIYTGQPFELYVRSPENGDLFDLTDYEIVFAGKETIDSDDSLFRYTDADVGLVTKSVVTLDNVDWNIQCKIPEEKVLEIHQSNIKQIVVGVLANHVGGADSIQIVPALTVRVLRGVAI